MNRSIQKDNEFEKIERALYIIKTVNTAVFLHNEHGCYMHVKPTSGADVKEKYREPPNYTVDESDQVNAIDEQEEAEHNSEVTIERVDDGCCITRGILLDQVKPISIQCVVDHAQQAITRILQL